MAFKPDPVQPDFSSLLISLSNSKIQKDNYPLYQTIFFLVQNTQKARDLLKDAIEELDEQVSEILATSFLTVDNELNDFPNSRQLLPGTNITFDDSVDGERTINATGGSGGMVPMATGAEPLEIMSNGNGEVLLVGFDTDQPI
jgi:hypothetical protein